MVFTILRLIYYDNHDLQEWTSEDDEESVDEKSNNDVPQVCKVRYSSSFGEFSDLTEKPGKLLYLIELCLMENKKPIRSIIPLICSTYTVR